MGLRSSKHKTSSYDISSVVSNKDFSYKKNPKLLPKVELPINQPATMNQKQDDEVLNVADIEAKESIENVDKKEVEDPRIPDWVNEKNFKKLLLKTKPTIIDVINFTAKPALAAGENYATLILRVQMTAIFENGSTKDFSFMLKVGHDTEQMKEMLQAMNFFITENTVYKEVLPELEEMYRQAGVEVAFGPKFHRLELEDENIHYVLMDDLSLDGFKNANRLECLNLQHTLSVLRKMAQFHAASACRVAKKGPYPAIFSPDVDNEMVRVMMQEMFIAFKKPFMENLKTYHNGEKYSALMDKFFDNLVELFVHSRKFLSGYFCVLNHGDSWSNNILFKYTEDGKLAETLFVDFQNCNWGSPALDLYYFILSSVQIDIKLSQFDYFIRYYYEHLSEHLKLLKYPSEILSFEKFNEQMKDFGSMATMTSFFTLGVVLLDGTDNAKFENFLGGSEESYNFKNAMYSNKRYHKYINEILPWLYNRGFMEINMVEFKKRIAEIDKLNEQLTVVPEETTPNTKINKESKCFYPEWVNESLFTDILRADYDNYHKVLKFDVIPATNVDNIYSTILLQVDIKVELTDHTIRNLSYILKIACNEDQAKALAGMYSSFDKETTMYNDIIPQFEQLYKEKCGIDVAFAPKNYKLNQDIVNDALLLENLKVKGFKNCDRLEGLDIKHTEAVLKKLAEFHAASACVIQNEGKFPEVIKGSIITEHNSEVIIDKRSQPCAEIYLDCARKYEGNEEYIKHVESYFKDCVTHLSTASRIGCSKFNVLNHGDCWTNNIMFLHDDQHNIIDTYFVDFQSARYGTPCFDLYYFLLSSPKLEIKMEQFDHFIRYYHENLKANLELLKYPKDIPSLKELHMDLIENGVWALYTATGVMAAVLLDPCEKLNLDKIINEDDDGLAVKKQMFLSKLYRSHIEVMLPWMHRRGLINFA